MHSDNDSSTQRFEFWVSMVPPYIIWIHINMYMYIYIYILIWYLHYIYIYIYIYAYVSYGILCHDFVAWTDHHAHSVTCGSKLCLIFRSDTTGVGSHVLNVPHVLFKSFPLIRLFYNHTESMDGMCTHNNTEVCSICNDMQWYTMAVHTHI